MTFYIGGTSVERPPVVIEPIEGLIINGDFSSGMARVDNNILGSDVNDGWVAKNLGSGGFQIIADEAVTASHANDFAIAQVNKIAQTGSIFNVSFDWTPAVGSTGADLTMGYSVMGWSTTGAGAADGDKMFTSVATGVNEAKTDGDDTALTAYNLLNGVTSTGTISLNQNKTTGVAGVTGHYSLDIDIQGVADLSELEWFGIAFVQAGSDGGAGSVLDNVSVTVGAGGPPVDDVEASIISFVPYSAGVIAMTVDSSNPTLSYPKSKLNLAIPGGWSSVEHSADGLDPFIVTNLDYSTAAGTNFVIYVKGTSSAEFFQIGAE